jgi:hypothetical protein
MRYAILGMLLVGQLAGQMGGPGGGAGNRVPVLQTAEQDRLLLMREEEKLAGDVYRFFSREVEAAGVQQYRRERRPAF